MSRNSVFSWVSSLNMAPTWKESPMGVHQTTRASRRSGSEKALSLKASTSSITTQVLPGRADEVMRQIPLWERSRVRAVKVSPSVACTTASTSTWKRRCRRVSLGGGALMGSGGRCQATGEGAARQGVQLGLQLLHPQIAAG